MEYLEKVVGKEFVDDTVMPHVVYLNGYNKDNMICGKELICDLKKIAEQSDIAKKILDSNMVIIAPFYMSNQENYESSFHPNGNTGCIEMDDDYIFGIRCNHLIWMEGMTEGCCKYDVGIWDDCVVLMGNHKGNFEGHIIC